MMSNSTRVIDAEALLAGIEPADVDRLMYGEHTQPHAVLGAHPVSVGNRKGAVVRTMHPDAVGAACIMNDGSRVRLEKADPRGLFAGFLPNATLPLRYRLRFEFKDGNAWELADPYRFLPTVGETDLYLFNEGTHRRLWHCLGAHRREIDGVAGTSFAVWAPHARRVSIIGEFNNWDGRLMPMRNLGASGVFEIFVPGVEPGAHYKFEIKTREGALRVKTDPFAFSMEMPPATASRVVEDEYVWGDDAWMRRRKERDVLREPMAAYEVHLGSWMRAGKTGKRPLTYREIAPKLVDHMKRLHLNYVELMPVAEHPFAGSWGYQVSGYYAPTARFGPPEDFKYFVDLCHQNDIGVIIDWVPAHFPKDDFALRRFDGTALYEHEDVRRGEHPDWGTLIFNYGRHEVRNFLTANALFWLGEYHVDGLRVDAVASMLYLDYSRRQHEWLPNQFGGRENLEAIDFLRHTNQVIADEHPGCFTVAEESTAWPGVTRPANEGGLGFTLKWNMGWMHDTLEYFSRDPVYRHCHQDQLTFAMMYEYSEHFLMPLSHDEVVHGKRSLLEKMPGDLWQRFANLRLLLAYQYTRPGKQILFMGTEIAPYIEWNFKQSLDWHLVEDSWRAGLLLYMEDLGRLYQESPCLWHSDPDPMGFVWIDCSDRENSVVSYWRRLGGENLIVVLNLTPVPRENYVIGSPYAATYECVLNSDGPRYAGSGYPVPGRVTSEPTGMHGFDQSIRLTLPPLATLILRPAW